METIQSFIGEIGDQFKFAAFSIIGRTLLFGFFGFMTGIALVVIGHKRKWFKREFMFWSLAAKLNYLYLPVLLLVLGGVIGSFYGVKKTADHFIGKAATPVESYAQALTANILDFLPNPEWAKQNDLPLSEWMGKGVAEKAGFKPGSYTHTATVAINVGIVEHVLNKLGVPELVRDPVGLVRIFQEKKLETGIFSGMTHSLQMTCGHFIWLKYKVVLFFFLPFLFLPVGEYLVHRVFRAVRRRVSGGSKSSGNMVQVYFFLGTALLFSACSKEDDNLDPGVPGASYVNAKIDGKLVKTITYAASLGRYKHPDPQHDSIYFVAILSVEGAIPYSNTLALGVSSANIPTAKTYEMDGKCSSGEDCPALGYEIEPAGNNSRDFSSEEGNVKIKFDILEFKSGGRVKGTFSGVVVEDVTGEKIVVTEGKFDVLIQ